MLRDFHAFILIPMPAYLALHGETSTKVYSKRLSTILRTNSLLQITKTDHRGPTLEKPINEWLLFNRQLSYEQDRTSSK